jgi:hypothetical protein
MASKITKTIIIDWFVVQGTAYFPFDMLRYDMCFPATEDDALALDRKDFRRVVLQRRAEGGSPNSARWASFNWTLVDTFNNHGDARACAKDLPELGARSG